MRKIYLFDMGLLVLAGTIAAVLTDKPVHPETSPEEEIAGDVVSCADVLKRTECEPDQVRPK